MEFVDKGGRKMTLALGIPQGTVTFNVYRPDGSGGSIELAAEQFRELGTYLLDKADFAQRVRDRAEATRLESGQQPLHEQLESAKKAKAGKPRTAKVFIPASP